jgi:hypothetical protein
MKSLRASLLALLLFGCAPAQDVARWTEEVKSHDGSVLLLEGRSIQARQPIVSFQHRGPLISDEYYHRATGAYWKSPGSGLTPGGFDLVGGVPYMVVPVGSEIVCIWFDFPEKDMLVFRWENNGWRRARFADLPPGFDLNLLINKFNERDRRRDVTGLVTLGTKRFRDGEAGGGIKGFFDRRDGGTWCASHKTRYEKLGRKPLEAFRTDEVPPELEGSHGTPGADLMSTTKHKTVMEYLRSPVQRVGDGGGRDRLATGWREEDSRFRSGADRIVHPCRGGRTSCAWRCRFRAGARGACAAGSNL